MNPCPFVEKLPQWLEGIVPEQEQADLSSHISHCSECQTVLDQLTAFSMIELRSGQSHPVRDEFVHFLQENLWESESRNTPHRAEGDTPRDHLALQETGSFHHEKSTKQTGLHTPHQQTGLPSPHQPRGLPSSSLSESYELMEELGRGGMGVVYKARQPRLDRLVALKMILHIDHASTEEKMRFEREAQAIARLNHPNIVQIYEIGERDGSPFFSLELIHGGNLAGKLDGKPLAYDEAARLVATLAEGIEVAHRAGVVHRHLKPANVLMTEDGIPKITDFGLAKHLDVDTDTQTGAIMGTPSYMAPEQAAGDVRLVGPAVDFYALGAILYECLTGQPPFKAASSLETVLEVLEREPIPPSRLQQSLPKDLETITLKCLEKTPEKRYESAESLGNDLQRYLRGEAISARTQAGC